MRLAGEFGLPGKTDRLTNLNRVADFHHRAISLEMVVIGKRSIGMLDDDVIPERLKLRIRSADRRIVAHSDDAALARRADDRPFRNVPVDRVFTARSSKVTEGAAR